MEKGKGIKSFIFGSIGEKWKKIKKGEKFWNDMWNFAVENDKQFNLLNWICEEKKKAEWKINCEKLWKAKIMEIEVKIKLQRL